MTDRAYTFFFIANIIVGLLFVFAALLQYNDPDAARWIALYSSSAVACVMWSYSKSNRWLYLIILLVSIIWIGFLIIEVEQLSFRIQDVVSSLEMKNNSIEQVREIGGLIFVASWMSILVFKAGKNK